MEWSDEHIDALKELFNSGISFAKIADEMSSRFKMTFTRNAIMGKSHRLKFNPETREKKPRIKVVKKTTDKKPTPPQEVMEIPAFLPSRNEPLKNITINELTSNTCKWPYGNRPPYTYCGRLSNGSFCKEHSRMAYVKPILRARRNWRWK